MTQLATKQKKLGTIRQLLTQQNVKDQIAMVAPRHLTPERITRIAMTSIQRTPKLLDCTPESLLGSVLTCSQLGLEPDSVSGRAYLLPYGTTCTLIVGYRGLMDLARRSGEIECLEARVVHENDKFEYQYGTCPDVHHVPTLGERGNPVAVYAVAVFKHGGRQFEVMSKDEVESIRSKSRAAKSGPWVTDWSEMARKTVLRRLCKYLPSSPELQQAVSLDEQADRGIPQDIDIIDVEPPAAATKKNGRRKTAKTLDDVVDAADATEPDANGNVEHLRKFIKDGYLRMQPEEAKAFLGNCELNAIGDIGGIEDATELQSIADAMKNG